MIIVYWYILSNRQTVERFWEFTNSPGHDAKSFTETIQASLEKVLEKAERCDANVISGHHAGVQAFIQRTYKNAVCIVAHINPFWLLESASSSTFFQSKW